MKKLFITIYIMSITDSILTCIGISNGIIVELVPVIRNFYNNSPLASVMVDILATSILFAIIWRVRRKMKWIVYPLMLILPIKAFAIILHVGWIIEIVRAL
jgi:hypothetical protein